MTDDAVNIETHSGKNPEERVADYQAALENLPDLGPAEPAQEPADQDEAAVPEDGLPPRIEDILAVWNDRFPDDNRILDLDDLAGLVTQDEIDDVEFVLIQTMFAFLVDSQTNQAALNVISDVAKAFIKRGARKATKNVRSQARVKSINADANVATVALQGLAVDMQNGTVNPIDLLRDLNEQDYSADDFAHDLEVVDKAIDEQYRKAGVR